MAQDYLKTLRTPLIAGRDFSAQDSADTQLVTIVNQAFVDRFWPGQNAIGKRICAATIGAPWWVWWPTPSTDGSSTNPLRWS